MAHAKHRWKSMAGALQLAQRGDVDGGCALIRHLYESAVSGQPPHEDVLNFYRDAFERLDTLRAKKQKIYSQDVLVFLGLAKGSGRPSELDLAEKIKLVAAVVLKRRSANVSLEKAINAIVKEKRLSRANLKRALYDKNDSTVSLLEIIEQIPSYVLRELDQ